MATTLETLVVRIAADGQQMQRTLDRLERQTRQSSRQIERAFQGPERALRSLNRVAISVRASFAGLGAVLATLGVTALVGAVREATSFGAAIQDVSDKVGVSTAFLQEWRYAAELTGVAASQADTALQRFSRRVGEAINGTGVLAEALEEQNIALRDNNGQVRRVEDILDDYADAIANAGSQQEALLLANRAFDIEGAALVNTLRGGSDALAAMRKEANDLGAVLDEQLIDRAASADEEIDKLSLALDVQLKAILIELAPLLRAVANLLLDAAVAARRWFDQLRGGLAAQRIMAEDDVAEMTDDIVAMQERIDAIRRDATPTSGPGAGLRAMTEGEMAAIQGLQSELDALIDARDARSRFIDGIRYLEENDPDSGYGLIRFQGPLPEGEPGSNILPPVAPDRDPPPRTSGGSSAQQRGPDPVVQLNRQIDALNMQRSALGLSAGAAARLTQQHGLLATAIADGADTQFVYSDAVQAGLDDLAAATDALEEATRLDRLRLEVITATTTQQEAYNATLADLDQLLAQGAITAQQFNDYIGQLDDGAVTAMDAVEAVVRASTENINGLLDGLIEGNKSLLESFRDYAIDVLDQIIAKLTEINADALLDVLGIGGSGGSGGGGGLGGFLGGLFGGGGAAAGAGAAGGTFHFPLGGLYAEGGNPPLGVPSIVGERGPELIVPRIPTTVIPNHALGGGGPSVTIHQTIDARGAEIGVEQRIAVAMRQAKAETKAEIYAAMNAGGRVAKISGRRPA